MTSSGSRRVIVVAVNFGETRAWRPDFHVDGYLLVFCLRVGVLARTGSRERARRDGYAVAPSKEAFFSECDVISLHMRLVDATRGIVTTDDSRA